MSISPLIPVFPYDCPVENVDRISDEILSSIRLFIQKVLYQMTYKENELISGLKSLRTLLAKDRFLPEKLPMHLAIIKEQLVDLLCLCEEQDFVLLPHISPPIGYENLISMTFLVRRELRAKQMKNSLARDIELNEICRELTGLKEFSRSIKIAEKIEDFFGRAKAQQMICFYLLREGHLLEALEVAQNISHLFLRDRCYSEAALAFARQKNLIRAQEIASRISVFSLRGLTLEALSQKHC